MSLLDTRYPDLDNFLQRWRRRLNTRFFAGEGLAAWSALVPAVTAIAFAFQAQPVARLVLGAVLAVPATLAFVLWRRRRSLSRHDAASWLDERGTTRGLFRAASECLDLPVPGRAGTQVLDEADRRRTGLTGASAPRLPRRRLGLRGLAAAGLTAAAAAVLMLVPPVPGFPGTTPKSPDPALGLRLTPDRPGGDPGELSPKEAAQRLFPEDARLAALAEQALASGDPGALESLLEQNAAQAGRGASPQGAPAPGGPPGQAPGEAGSQDGAPSPEAGQKVPGKSGQMGSSPGSPDRQPPGAENQGSSGGKSPGKPGRSSDGEDQAPSGGPSTPAPGGNRPGPNGSGGPAELPSGGAPGTGHSRQPLGQAPQGASDRQLVLKDQDNQGVFEYVLPGAGPQLPAAQTLADSRRSAEAVISRTSPPLEFENTIREYFLSLTTLTQAQEAAP